MTDDLSRIRQEVKAAREKLYTFGIELGAKLTVGDTGRKNVRALVAIFADVIETCQRLYRWHRRECDVMLSRTVEEDCE